MLKLPKVQKGVRSGTSRLGKVKRAIVGVALAMGVVFAGIPVDEAQATITQSVQQSATTASGTVLLELGSQTDIVVAGHYSHSSHASHASHYSHMSSRY